MGAACSSNTDSSTRQNQVLPLEAESSDSAAPAPAKPSAADAVLAEPGPPSASPSSTAAGASDSPSTEAAVSVQTVTDVSTTNKVQTQSDYQVRQILETDAQTETQQVETAFNSEQQKQIPLSIAKAFTSHPSAEAENTSIIDTVSKEDTHNQPRTELVSVSSVKDLTTQTNNALNECTSFDINSVPDVSADLTNESHWAAYLERQQQFEQHLKRLLAQTISPHHKHNPQSQ